MLLSEPVVLEDILAREWRPGGSPVTFVVRSQRLEDIQRNGLTVQSSRGGLHLDNVHAIDSIQRVESVDLIPIAVRLRDTEEVA